MLEALQALLGALHVHLHAQFAAITCKLQPACSAGSFVALIVASLMCQQLANISKLTVPFAGSARAGISQRSESKSKCSGSAGVSPCRALVRRRETAGCSTVWVHQDRQAVARGCHSVSDSQVHAIRGMSVRPEPAWQRAVKTHSSHMQCYHQAVAFCCSLWQPSSLLDSV